MQILLMALVLLAIFVLIAVRFFRGRIPAEPTVASGEPPAPGVTSPSASVDPNAIEMADIAALAITLDVDERPSLFILLSADGSINRMGSGTLEDTDHELFVGRIDPAIFEAVRSHLTAAMLQRLGQVFQSQNTRGVACKLELNFQFRDGTSNGLGFLYGSESEGMPRDVADFVTAAVHETDPWYENFKRTAAGRHKP